MEKNWYEKAVGLIVKVLLFLFNLVCTLGTIAIIIPIGLAGYSIVGLTFTVITVIIALPVRILLVTISRALNKDYATGTQNALGELLAVYLLGFREILLLATAFFKSTDANPSQFHKLFRFYRVLIVRHWFLYSFVLILFTVSFSFASGFIYEIFKPSIENYIADKFPDLIGGKYDREEMKKQVVDSMAVKCDNELSILKNNHKQEKDSLIDAFDKVKAENDSLSQKVKQLSAPKKKYTRKYSTDWWNRGGGF